MRDTEKMLEKVCETLAEYNPDFICDDLNCGDGWCEENCTQNGYETSTKCVKRWLEKQIKKDPECR